MSNATISALLTNNSDAMSDVRPHDTSNLQSLKIVVDGARGCGKTTFVNALSEIAPDVPLAPGQVAMDFGRVTVDDGLVLYLFGMPGGRRYDFMWEILHDGLLGFIVILDSRHPYSFRESKSIFETMRAYAPVPYVLAANFQDIRDRWRVNDLRIALHIPADVPIIPCVATERESVKRVILTLLEQIVDAIDEADVDSGAAL